MARSRVGTRAILSLGILIVLSRLPTSVGAPPDLPPLPDSPRSPALRENLSPTEDSSLDFLDRLDLPLNAKPRSNIRPRVLSRPIGDDPSASPNVEESAETTIPLPFQTPVDPPTGFTGRSSVLPSESQVDPHFVPVEDRWRIGFPNWDRYGREHPLLDDYPYLSGRWSDPFNQNVIKGDFPIIGQHLFLEVAAQGLSIQEFRQVPVGTSAFESTSRANEGNFFQKPNQYFTTNFFSLAFDFLHGDAAFKPADWRIRLVPVFNVNSLSGSELAVVSPNVLAGTSRTREFWALQEAFFETRLGDTSSEYDFASVRVGNQPFISDFRGFLFSDVNRAVRLFGTANGNRDQYNIAYFRQWEKDTNSQLNTFQDRNQNLFFANYYRQDFLFPGYTAQVSVNVNNDQSSFKFNKDGFLVRPDPMGIARPHTVNVAYLGWAGDGHIGRYNLTHQFYWALGYDSLNPLANQAQTINAQMFAIEGSYDRDWARFRISFFYSSGDHNINNSHATGFDTILDAPNFAGGQFSYWNRQQLPVFGVNLVQRLSLVPDLRSSKFQGQANFVNPGLLLPTLGVDFDLTPRLKMLNNLNFIWFDSTNVLEQFLYDGRVHNFVGTDLSTGFEYRPLLSDNVSFIFGVSMLFTGQGFRDIFSNPTGNQGAYVATFGSLVALY